MSMKNSNDIIGNRTRHLLACSTMPQPTAPTRAPRSACRLYLYSFISINDYARSSGCLCIALNRDRFQNTISTLAWRDQIKPRTVSQTNFPVLLFKQTWSVRRLENEHKLWIYKNICKIYSLNTTLCYAVSIKRCFTSFSTATCFGSFLWSRLQAELLKKYYIQLTLFCLVRDFVSHFMKYIFKISAWRWLHRNEPKHVAVEKWCETSYNKFDVQVINSYN